MLHSIYLHIPFCEHRCAYCDFNTYADQQELIAPYVEALQKEVRHAVRRLPGTVAVHTIFLGGGTPSLLSARQVEQILSEIRGGFHVQADAEVTLEANPGTISAERLAAYRTAGVNRISLGVQSANGEELRMLERMHSFADVMAGVAAVRRAGYDNLNLDLIYGLPGQQMSVWKTTVHRILKLDPEHISAYALTIEHGTPFGHWTRRGTMASPDPDLAADMYDWFSEEMERTGYQQYEISNWAREGHQCRHNLQYWRAEPYLGFGAGAHGYSQGHRYANVLSIRDYIERMVSDDDGSGASHRDGRGIWISQAVLGSHRQSPQDEMSEFMIMGLRLTRDGVNPDEFARRFGKSLEEVYGAEISRLSEQGLLEIEMERPSPEDGAPVGDHGKDVARRVRLSRRGRLLGNRAFAEFVTT